MSRITTHRFDVITIFPEMIDSYARESILGRAQKKKLIDVKSHDLRAFTTDKHKTVDDTPYGGGAGMLMKVEPIDKALRKIKKRTGDRGSAVRGSEEPSGSRRGTRVIMTAASGKTFTQADARRLAEYQQVIFVCGRYEGIDHRVEEHLVDESLSIGNYVLTGGELPALVMIDAIARMIPGVLGSQESLQSESHDEEGVLEYPQYTKPDTYKTWKVPEVLLSGDHRKIALWREQQKKK